MQLLFVFGCSVMTSLAFTWFIRRHAKSLGFIDRPGAHKQHADLTPTLGGVGILGALLVPALLFPFSAKAMALLSAATLVTLVGAIDDVRNVRATHKLAVLGLAACIVCQGGWPTGADFPFPLNLVFSFLWVGLVSSAFNGVDNADGAAGGLTCVSALLCLLVGVTFAHPASETLILAASLAGACLGFLFFNFPHPKASIFLGDSGSLLIGLVASCLAVDVTGNSGLFSFVFAGLLLCVPLFDFFLILTLRGLKGQYHQWTDPITMCARDHTFHRLQAFGLSTRTAVLWMYLFAIAVGVGVGLSWFISGRQGVQVCAVIVTGLAGLTACFLNYAPLDPDVYAPNRSVR